MTKGTFNCSGKVNIHDWQLNPNSLFLQKEVHNVLEPERVVTNLVFEIFGSKQPGINILLNLKHFVCCMEANLKILMRHEKSSVLGKQPILTKEIDYFSIRETVCQYLLFLRDYLQSVSKESFSLKDISEEVDEEFFNTIRTIQRFLRRIYQIPDSLFCYATSNTGNKCSQPGYHLYHLHLDLRWLTITLMYKYDKSLSYLGSSNSVNHVQDIIQTTTDDLIYIAVKIFSLIPVPELRAKTPYSCTCVRELWIMLQMFVDKLCMKGEMKPFWTYVNITLGQLVLGRSTGESNVQQRKNNTHHCKNPELFCLWLIYHLTMLYGYNENGERFCNPSSRSISTNREQVETILKAYVIKGGKDGDREELDEELRVMIPLLHDLICNWWEPQVKIITLLWDCFHRRLDSPFLVQSRGPWSLSSEKKSPMEILNQVKDRIQNSTEIGFESSFGLFLRLLGTFLQNNYNGADSKFWNQIKGRIFSRFSQNKIIEFSESGLFNFINLFFTMAVTADTINVSSAVLNLLPKSHEFEWNDSSGGKRYSLIWRAKLAVLLLYKEQRLSYREVADDFTETANKICCRKDEFASTMMTWFIDVFRLIMMHSDDFNCEEHTFIGGWIDRYLKECPLNRTNVLTTSLLEIFDKCSQLRDQNSSGSALMLEALWCHVASRIRQMMITFDVGSEFYENSTKLAVLFTCEACRNPHLSGKYKHTPASLFQHFSTSTFIKDIRISRFFLVSILKNDEAVTSLKKDVPNFNVICIQLWVRYSILNKGITEDMDFLKSYITSLPEFQDVVNPDSEIHEFLQSHEPILYFLACMSRRRRLMKVEQITSFDNACRQYFHNMDRWICSLINEDNRDSELSLWTYQCVGTMILCCSPILYVKNQPCNLLRALIHRIALPTDQSGQTYLLNPAQKIFSMIILGFENLNYKSEITLQTLIRELFERFLPILVRVDARNEDSFKVVDTMSKCFLEGNISFTCWLLDFLRSNFIVTPKENATHKHCHLAMLLLRNLIRLGTNCSSDFTDSIISICTTSIVNCYIRVHDHHPHRRQTIDYFKDISTSKSYKENCMTRKKLNEAVWNALNKSILTHSRAIFEFFTSVSGINLEVVKGLYPNIEKVVLESERVGRPNSSIMRLSLEKLKKKAGI
ncbi:hypothetical protein QAD02_015970 [Eretmocerus hayati]|uniref:Uncharacterized protein n=1 Tax=Eretmocerus hayati TaxID=131215 RepID=A0ACC2P9R4_9HYME|nr:hypothetical protein QAD02_015970 [Eretmocerus hayati]